MNLEFWKGKKVFLTGHTGFKGSWLSLWLKNLGVELTGYSLDVNYQNSFFLDANISDEMKDRLNRASAVCQLVAYLSLVGVCMMWYNISNYVGAFFIISSLLAIIFIRIAMNPASIEAAKNVESTE